MNNEKFNCPNCGAAITGAKCEYCGTLFEKEPAAQKEPDTVTLYTDGEPFAVAIRKAGCSFKEAVAAFAGLKEE